MSIDINVLMRLLDPNIHLVDFEKIMMDYAALKEKLDHTEAQSFYFKLAIDGKKEELAQLKKRFNIYRHLFKKYSAYKLRKKIQRQEERKLRINTPSDLNLMAYMQLDSINHQIAVYKNLLELKGRTADLKPIDFYTQHPDQMLKLLNY